MMKLYGGRGENSNEYTGHAVNTNEQKRPSILIENFPHQRDVKSPDF